LELAQHRPSWVLLAAYLLAVALGAVAMVTAQAYLAGFSGADEPSHFLNGYFISSYLRDHFGSNPLAFATDFYIHYPKISIGHWPPAYYGLLGTIFLVLPPTYTSIFILNVLVAALPAIGVAAALARLSGRGAALAGALIYALAPLTLEGQAMFMVDQPLAACLVAATALWIAYAHKPGWALALGFAALSALAVLVKGNGWVALFIPFFHSALTGNWRRLVSVKLFVAAAVAAMVVVPWYLVTAKIAADGFNYQAGVGYALRALRANVAFLADNISWAGIALALYAVVSEFRDRAASALRWSIVSGLVSLIVATLTLQSLVPVDIVDRYMVPALPAMVVLAVLGAIRVLALVRGAQAGIWRVVGVGVLAALMVRPGLHHLFEREPKADVGAMRIAQKLAPAARPAVTVIDGSTGYEGAFIAAMAVHDPLLQSYVVRASKLFADSNFMGSAYTLKYQDSDGVLGELRRLGVQSVVLVRVGERSAFPHSEQLREALALPDSGYRLSESVAHQNRAGVTEVYESAAPVAPNIAAVRNMGVPAKAAAIVKQ
jgi:hypothetical protein